MPYCHLNIYIMYIHHIATGVNLTIHASDGTQNSEEVSAMVQVSYIIMYIICVDIKAYTYVFSLIFQARLQQIRTRTNKHTIAIVTLVVQSCG